VNLAISSVAISQELIHREYLTSGWVVYSTVLARKRKWKWERGVHRNRNRNRGGKVLTHETKELGEVLEPKSLENDACDTEVATVSLLEQILPNQAQLCVENCQVPFHHIVVEKFHAHAVLLRRANQAGLTTN